MPGAEKNKGAILTRAVQWIQKLQDDASQNIDKWTFEKMVTEQAINDLSGKLSRAWNEKEFWKRIASEHGVDMEAANANLALELEVVGATGVESSETNVDASVVNSQTQDVEQNVADVAGQIEVEQEDSGALIGELV